MRGRYDTRADATGARCTSSSTRAAPTPSGKSPTSSVDLGPPPLTPQVDSTKRILDWVLARGAAIIDVNVLPKPPISGVRAARDPDRIMERRLAEHVWDTIVECVRRSERR